MSPPCAHCHWPHNLLRGVRLCDTIQPVRRALKRGMQSWVDDQYRKRRATTFHWPLLNPYRTESCEWYAWNRGRYLANPTGRGGFRQRGLGIVV